MHSLLIAAFLATAIACQTRAVQPLFSLRDQGLDQRADRHDACSCPAGCGEAGRCSEIVPSNGFVAPSTPLSLSPVRGLLEIRTDTCTGTEPGVAGSQFTGETQSSSGISNCLFRLERLEIAAGGRLRAIGARPLVLLIDGDVVVEQLGLLDASADAATPGPGGNPGGNSTRSATGGGAGQPCSACDGTRTDSCGGGGAGYGETGAAGGAESTPCTVAASAGAAVGETGLTPLESGSGGARGGADASVLSSAGAGGAGGGALQITAQGRIVIDGAIDASGGGGRAGSPAAADGNGGGGGGAGGAILLEATQISGTGIVSANGGGGAGGGGQPSCGLGDNGEDGAVSLQPAQGGIARGSCGAGGMGGTGTRPPTAGSPSGSARSGGGGGGGAAGRVRYNLPVPTALAPVSTSAHYSVGPVNLR